MAKFAKKWKSKLVNGKIPKNTECPFKAQCPLLPGCHHKGLEHSIDFSCGTARLHDTIAKYE